jgi:hypothetical protein
MYVYVRIYIYEKQSTDTDLSDHCGYTLSELKFFTWSGARVFRNPVMPTDHLSSHIIDVAWISVTL